MNRIDPETAAEIKALLLRCRIGGLDPIPVLDAHNLLDYHTKRAEARKWYTRQLVETLEQLTPTQLGDGVIPPTAADMKHAILNFLRKLT